VHPAVFEHYAAGTMLDVIKEPSSNGTAPKGLTAEEKSILRLLTP
jgi:hypothetical protein